MTNNYPPEQKYILTCPTCDGTGATPRLLLTNLCQTCQGEGVRSGWGGMDLEWPIVCKYLTWYDLLQVYKSGNYRQENKKRIEKSLESLWLEVTSNDQALSNSRGFLNLKDY